jgi:peptidoglycan hydrolase-like protein with peptidoglycan-binding domain
MLTKVGLPVKIDGIFGQETLKAVYAYQAKKGLPNSNLVGNGFWTLISRESGMTKGATTPTVTTAPTIKPTAPSQPTTATAPVTTQPQTQQQSGGFDLLKTFNDVSKTVQQYAPAAQQLYQTGQQVFGGQQQPQTGSVGNNPAATPPTVAQPTTTQQNGVGKSSGTTPVQTASQNGVQGASQSGGTTEPQYTYVVTEAPYKTALRYGVPAILGVGAGIGTHKAMDKPNMALSIAAGTVTAVASYFLGNVAFPPTEQVLTEEQIKLLEQQNEAQRQAA